MEYAIQILEEKLIQLTSTLTDYVHLADGATWKELNAKKRVLKRAISILKDGNKVQDQNDSKL
jgi:hypothetical protein